MIHDMNDWYKVSPKLILLLGGPNIDLHNLLKGHRPNFNWNKKLFKENNLSIQKLCVGSDSGYIHICFACFQI